MSEESTSALERDAERVRAQIADTAEHLKEKMSPGQLMDEVVNYFKDNGDSSQLIGNLKHQVRDNPLALALVGSGLAWLMMGSGPGGTAGLPSRNHLAGDGSNRRPLAGSNTYGGLAGDSTSSASDGSGLGGSAAALGEKVSDMAGSVADSATRGLHDLRDTSSGSYAHASQASSAAVDQAKSTFLDALDREPLVLGALGVAVGAAIGAMLPPTRLEHDYLGGASSKVREGAEDLVAEGIDKAKKVASDAYSAARDEADSQGLMPHGKPIAEKLADVARAAGAEIKSAAAETVDKVEASADEASKKWSPGGSRS
jgi:hypothetical protein